MPTRHGPALPTSPARLHISGQAYDVLILHAEEALSTPWHARLSVRTGTHVLPEVWLAQSAQLLLPGVETPPPRVLSGIVRAVRRTQRSPGDDTAHSDNAQHTLIVRLSSHLSRLAHTTDARVLLGLSLTELVYTVCTAHGMRADQLVFHLSRAYPVRPYTVQAMESDLAFLHRVLARAGVFYYSRATPERHTRAQ